MPLRLNELLDVALRFYTLPKHLHPCTKNFCHNLQLSLCPSWMILLPFRRYARQITTPEQFIVYLKRQILVWIKSTIDRMRYIGKQIPRTIERITLDKLNIFFFEPFVHFIKIKKNW